VCDQRRQQIQAIRADQVKKTALILVKAGVVVAIYAVVLRRVSFSRIESLLTPGFCLALFIGVLLNLAQAILCTLRWMAVARGVANVPSFFQSLSAYLEGLFFNQALPSFVGGDAVRVVRWRAAGVILPDAVLSVLRDRLFGAMGAALLALVACGWMYFTPIETYKVDAAIMLSAAALLGSIGVLLALQSNPLARMVERYPRIQAFMKHVADSPLRGRQWLELMSNSVVGQIFSGLSVYFLALSIGIRLPAVFLIAFTGVVLVVSMIPISLAGWGIREASFLAVLTPLGVPSESAIVLSIGFGLSVLLGAMPGGLCLLMGLSNPRDVPLAADLEPSISQSRK